MFVRYNANRDSENVGDCTVRAISLALGEDWDATYWGLCLQGAIAADMPSANHVWGAYLKQRGYVQSVFPINCPDCYSVRQFAADHPEGTYILALSGHVVCVTDGNYYDTWDSGDKVPLYYWFKED